MKMEGKSVRPFVDDVMLILLLGMFVGKISSATVNDICLAKCLRGCYAKPAAGRGGICQIGCAKQCRSKELPAPISAIRSTQISSASTIEDCSRKCCTITDTGFIVCDDGCCDECMSKLSPPISSPLHKTPRENEVQGCTVS